MVVYGILSYLEKDSIVTKNKQVMGYMMGGLVVLGLLLFDSMIDVKQYQVPLQVFET